MNAREEFQKALELSLRESYEEIKKRKDLPARSIESAAKLVKENFVLSVHGTGLTHERGAPLPPEPQKNAPWAKWDDPTIFKEIELWLIEKHLTALKEQDPTNPRIWEEL